ncbi:MAG TPA: hypothetical protein VMH61_02455 [Candidatus Acidoferrales bacterium]|nr:hypothetical protein [Candidatus Acidoferrales bacterium]
MNVAFTPPLARAWDRMVRMLFRPFRIEAWFVTGFAAFLTRALQSLGGTFTSSGSPWHRGSRDFDDMGSMRASALHWLGNPAVLLAIAAALLFCCIVAIVLFWVGTRAQFVLLDNVLTGRSEFVGPWRRFGRLGRSLFLWSAVFSFTWIVPLVPLAVVFLGTLHAFISGSPIVWPAIGLLIATCGFVLVCGIVIAFIGFLLHEFIVPLMWRYDETATQAWARFWPLLGSQFGRFFAYAVFYLVLAIASGIAVLVAAVGTCCIGLVLIAIPYIGSCALLPVTVTGRGLGPEFLAQFGPEWNVLPAAAPEIGTPVV